MLKLNVNNETSRLLSVILGTAKSTGPIPKAEECYDPKSRENVLKGTYPTEMDMCLEIQQFKSVLEKYNVNVISPSIIKNYNQIFSRDIAFVIDDKFIVPNILEERDKEFSAIAHIVKMIDSDCIINMPDGVYVDVDGLAEVDLGNGTNYNPAEALNMYFQTGSIVGRSLTQDGDPNRGKVPIQELQTSSGIGKIQALIQTYQYYLQMIRDVTGLNEARDGSQPAKDSLVGLQKLAAAASNTATKHILQSLMYLTVRVAENISLRAADALSFPLLKNALISSINQTNVATLSEIEKLNMHEFGIFLELEPEQEEQAQLEQNIQIAIKAGQIGLEDAIDIREINNFKLANQLLKQKQRQKAEAAAAAQQQNIQMQAQANAQASEQAALAEMQKQQALTESKLQLEQGKSQFEIQRMEMEAQIKRQLMEQEFQYNMQLAQVKTEVEKQKEKEIEDRKDQRARIIGTQQSEMIKKNSRWTEYSGHAYRCGR